LEGEDSVEGNNGAGDLWVQDWLDDGGVLLVDVDDGELGVVDLGQVERGALPPLSGVGVAEVRWKNVGLCEAGNVEAEHEVLVFGLDVRGINGEDTEDLELDELLVGAGSRYDETLESGEGEVAGAGCQERRRAGDQVLVLKDSVEAILLAFLSDDRCDTTGIGVVVVVGEDLNDILESAEDDICEG
jgi:hypothetical protein